MSNDQAKALRCACIVMKEKFLNYNVQVGRKHVFPIATVLDPRFKLGHIPYGEHNMLESVRIIEASSCMSIDDLLASSSHKRSKVRMSFMEQQSNRSTTLDEKSAKVQ